MNKIKVEFKKRSQEERDKFAIKTAWESEHERLIEQLQKHEKSCNKDGNRHQYEGGKCQVCDATTYWW